MDDAPRPDPELGNAGTPEERRTGLGGSDAPVALGISPWRSPYDLWEEKIGVAPPLEQTEPMLWGKLFEDIIRREYARRTGFEVRQVPELIRHPEHPFMFAHIDGEVDQDYRRILEVKMSRTGLGWGEPETDDIPMPYLVQVNHYLAVVPEAEVCDVAVLIGGQDFRIYRVGRDKQIERDLIERERAFWSFVEMGIPPPPSTVADAVKRWGRFDAQKVVIAGEQEMGALAILHRAHQLRAELDAAEEQAKLTIQTALGEEGQSLINPYGEVLVTWKLDNGRKGYSVAARAPSRQFRIKNLEAA